jgi:hypothetical protein
MGEYSRGQWKALARFCEFLEPVVDHLDGLSPFHSETLTLTRILVVSSYFNFQHVNTYATGNSPSSIQGTIRKGDEEIENWPPRLGQGATRRWISTTEEG